jgi:hypothetical protein
MSSVFEKNFEICGKDASKRKKHSFEASIFYIKLTIYNKLHLQFNLGLICDLQSIVP